MISELPPPSFVPFSIGCAKCGSNEKLFRCVQCYLVSYCGKSCQTTDWAKHKQMCRVWKPVTACKLTWKSLNATFSFINAHVAPLIVDKFGERVMKKTAIDLGCGIGSSTLHLLRLGWKVIALDRDELSLRKLKERVLQENADWLQNNQLTIINQTIEEYTFPQNVSLILANDVLPYVDPTLVSSLWNKIHAALEANGHFVGSLFFDDGSLSNQVMRMKFGPWFIDQEYIKAILELDKLYQTENAQERASACGTCVIEFKLLKHVPKTSEAQEGKVKKDL